MQPYRAKPIRDPVAPEALPIILALLLGGILALAVGSMQPWLALGGIAAGGFLLLFLTHPAWGVLAVLLLRASTDVSFKIIPGAGLPGGLAGALPNIGLIVTLTLVGGLYIVSRGLPLISLPGGRLLTLLLLTGLIGVARGGSRLQAMDEWIPVLAAFATYALVARLFSTPRQVQRILDVIAASFALPMLLGLYQLAVGQGVSRGAEFQTPGIVGTFVHPNSFGFYLVLVSALFLSQAVYSTGARRLLSAAALCLSVGLLIGTFARVAWAGMLVVFVVVAALRARMLLVGAPVAAFAIYRLIPSVSTRLSDPLASGGSLQDRLFNLWPALIEAWLTATGAMGASLVVLVNRLAGLGPGVAPGLARFGGYSQVTIPHNDYLRVLVEYGIFGLILHFALSGVLIVVAYRAWREFKSGNCPEAAVVAMTFLAVAIAFPVMSITDNIFAHTANQVYFWALAGLTVAVSRWKQQEQLRFPDSQ
jgi:O-antigen ligase